jgi:hypothetical protein
VAHFPRPFPGTTVAPFAHAKEDGTAGEAQGIADELVGTLRIHIRGVTPVVFQVIHTPTGILDRILIFMTERTRHAAQNSHSAYSSHDFLFGIMIFLIIFAAKIQKNTTLLIIFAA